MATDARLVSASPVQGNWAPPEQFDGFRVLRPLGTGGMGAVYLGHDTLLDRPVALKFVAPTSTDPESRARFLIEARAIARLQHPNVVAVYRIGEVVQTPYLVYEFVPGQPLDRLARPVSWQDALQMGLGIARGLAAAHRRGVLHRDIKPANVMLAESGEIKILDFGLAKLLDTGAKKTPFPGLDALSRWFRSTPSSTPRVAQQSPASESANGSLATQALPKTQVVPVERAAMPDSPYLTHAGMLLGTPLYLAPELWTGQLATARSDVYSLGLVLYELITGFLPHAEVPSSDLVRLVQSEDLAPVQLYTPEIPIGLAAIVDRCVRRNPEERFRSAEEVRDALETVALDCRMQSLWSETDSALRWSEVPKVHYARSGEFNIAYQVIGQGPLDLVFVPGFVSHLQVAWEEPSFARFLRQLASFSRLIIFDKRGTGLSDRHTQAPSAEERMDDIRAVMDAVGSERAVLFGMSDGAPLCAVFATTYPERTRSIVMFGAVARSLPAKLNVALDEVSLWDSAFEQIRTRWGEPVFIEHEAPSRAHEPSFRRWWANYLRMSAGPGAAAAILRLNAEIDITHLLSLVRVPTLVIHRKGDRLMPILAAKAMAERIPGAQFEALEGDDHLPFVGDSAAILRRVQQFLSQAQPSPGVPPVVATILAVVLSGPPPGHYNRQQLGAFSEELRQICQRQVATHRGTELYSTGLGHSIASFDGPARAVRCALAILEQGKALGIPLRAGLHTDQYDMTRIEVTGAELALRIAYTATPGQVCLSSAVQKLIPGAGLSVVPLSEAQIKALGTGVFAVHSGNSQAE